MEDHEIIELYWERNPDAINETDAKYRKYCNAIAKNILCCNEDAEECVNDTYWHVWNSIPPNRPKALSTYLAKIIRNLSFDKYRYRHASKRGGGEIELVLEELEDCVSGVDNVVQEYEKKELVQEINRFLDTLSNEKCNLFLCRYWYTMPVPEIANRFGMSKRNVSITLHRIRTRLKKYLLERGYDL